MGEIYKWSFGLAADGDAGELAGGFGFVEDELAVDEDVFESEGVLLGFFEGGLVDHRIGVEEGEVGPVALADQAAVF